MWADVEYVLSQLLIAELTDRIPVVYWPTHCLHNGYMHTNGFELYFEPVSKYTVFDVAKSEYSYYPPVWDEDNLLIDDPSRDTWIYRNIGDIMTCETNVLVGDVYFDIHNLLPFIKKEHPAYGMTVRQIYRYLIQKYIRLKSDIQIEIEGFYNSWLREDAPALAVHVCKVDRNEALVVSGGRERYRFRSKSYDKKTKNATDKKVKAGWLSWLPWKRKSLLPNAPYHEEIKKVIDQYNVKKIFLLTNSEEILEEYRRKYGDMIISTQCRRMTQEGNEKITYLESPMVKRRRGIEVLKDTYVASKCQFFIGNDFSSLSQAVVNLKEWADDNAKLLYWQVGKKKYPINRKFTVLERFRFFHSIYDFVSKRIKKS